MEDNNFREIQAQWATVRGRIRQKIGDAQFKSWIKPITLESVFEQKIILSVPSNFIRTRIIEQYLDLIKSYWLVQNLKINDLEIKVSKSSTKKTTKEPSISSDLSKNL
ncbi:MAG: hypothetical protein CMM99_01955 [Rickettsiales bacterium]|nr:hypothetical protein [Rickettsiales bacterium]